jgi:DNA repair exonuclease SbcCD ATPase subunit
LRVDVTRYDETVSDTNSSEITRLRQDVTRLRSEAHQPITSHVDRLLAQVDQRRQTAMRQRERCHGLRLEAEAISDQDTHHCSTCGQGLAGTDHLAEVITALEQKRISLAAQIKSILVEIDQCEVDAVASEIEVRTLRKNHASQRILLQEQAQAIEANIVQIEQVHHDHRTLAATRAIEIRGQMTERQDALDEQYRVLDSLIKEAAAILCPISAWQSRDALYTLRQGREKLLARLDIELNKTNPLKDKIDGLSGTLLEIDYSNLNELTLQVKHEQFLYKLLTSKDSFIRKRIIDQNLSFLNRCLNKYLDRLGLPHEIRFLPDLSVEITFLGRDFDFEQLSRGEMNRVILATSWSFRDTWESLNHPVNLLFLDECLDSGTDQAGIQAAVEVLTDMAQRGKKNIFLISHREELKHQIETVLFAVKDEQFTTFTADGASR